MNLIFPHISIRFLLPLALFLMLQPATQAIAQDADLEAFQRAEEMLSWNLTGTIFNNRVNPLQIDDNSFWYLLNTRDGDEYRIVSVSDAEIRTAFDHHRLAQAIDVHSDRPSNPASLALQNLHFHGGHSTITFRKNNSHWQCNLTTYECEITGKVDTAPPFSFLSPDGMRAIYTKEFNLWLYNLVNGEHTQLTHDGVEHLSYGTNNHGWSRSDRPILKWSDDSRSIATFRLDERDVGMMTLWRTQVGRPEADIWPYALPGDSIVPMLERIIINTETGETIWLDTPADHQRTSNCCGLIRQGDWADIEWNADASKLAFVSTSRDYKDVTLRVADAATGEVTTIYHEHDEVFFESNLTSRGIPNWRVLHDSNEFIWFTRKSNWGHLYLHDLNTGELKNPITSGDWNVIDILHLDEEKREIFFTGMGREEGRDPYFEHLYRVNFDGSELTLLTPENANHVVTLSSDASWFTDTFSTFDIPQKSVVRDRDGNLIMELEEADISDLLATGWRKPVPFSVKARDGETDLYGLMILPSDFDETKSYPIINMIYPGPQGGSLGDRVFTAGQRGQMQALAQLGFVVVAIDALGSSPLRSREFHIYYHGDMMDNGLPDQIAGMRELAEYYPFIDIDRAGIYGHSGGGFATSAAMFQYPEFFKVGVSSAGNHDNRGYTFYWGEKYQGLLEGNNYENQAVQSMAGNLDGHLLISYGTMDTNVHPAMTLLVVDELIRHNKDFELIVMPNRGHGYFNDPYHLRRSWEFFYRHLGGKTPPSGFRIGG